MAEISELRQELAQADRHLREGRERIARQAEVARQLDRDGHDTTDAEDLLRVLNEALAAMETHREHVLRESSCTPEEDC
jgi:hypothetical protein